MRTGSVSTTRSPAFRIGLPGWHGWHRPHLNALLGEPTERQTRVKGNVMSAHASGRWRRIALASMLLTATAALLIGRATASPQMIKVRGTFEGIVTTGADCDSPINLCVEGHLKGSIKGDLKLTAQSATPSGTASLTLVNSTSTVHTKDGDLFLATSAVADLPPGGGGEHSSV